MDIKRARTEGGLPRASTLDFDGVDGAQEGGFVQAGTLDFDGLDGDEGAANGDHTGRVIDDQNDWAKSNVKAGYEYSIAKGVDKQVQRSVSAFRHSRFFLTTHFTGTGTAEVATPWGVEATSESD